MQTKHISADDFAVLAEQDESHFFDFKARETDGRGIQKIVVGFANADGGEFIVGIRDKKEATDPLARWCGFTEIEAMNSSL